MKQMKVKKVPMRSCVITKERLEKRELFRIVRTPSSQVVIDLSGKLNGRGAYLKKDITVIKRARETKMLEKILGTKIDDSIYDELLNIIEEEGRE